MSVRRRIAGAMLALAALSLLPVSGAPARAAAAQDDLPTVTSVGHSFPPPPATVRGDGTVLVRIPWKATPGSEGICSFSIYTYDATTGVQLGSHHSAPGSARYFDVHLDPLRTDPSPSVYAIAVYPIDCVGDMGIGQVTNPFVVKNVYEGGGFAKRAELELQGDDGRHRQPHPGQQHKGSSFSIHTCYTNFA
jgi:hypothetical protein